MPSFHGVHQVGEVKCNSVAHQCGKIEAGDEIVQVNYQTVVSNNKKILQFTIFIFKQIYIIEQFFYIENIYLFNLFVLLL